MASIGKEEVNDATNDADFKRGVVIVGRCKRVDDYYAKMTPVVTKYCGGWGNY